MEKKTDLRMQYLNKQHRFLSEHLKRLYMYDTHTYINGGGGGGMFNLWVLWFYVCTAPIFNMAVSHSCRYTQLAITDTTVDKKRGGQNEREIEKKVTWHVAKYGYPYAEFVLCN